MFRFAAPAAPVLLLLLLACRKEPAQQGPQIIHAGLGVSNRLEVGMSLADVSKRNDDLQLERFWKPDAWPWEKLFQKPRTQRVTIPSLGAQIWINSPTDKILMFSFATETLPPTLVRSGSAEMSFLSNNVDRAEIIRAFGEPMHRLTNMSGLAALYNRGESVWISNSGVTPSEQFYYPDHGVFFRVNSGSITEMTITKKFVGTNSPAKP